MDHSKLRKETSCIHAGTLIDPVERGVNSPIHTSTSFPYLEEGIRYPRMGNTPNQMALVHKINQLESAEEGLLFASGMGAISAALLTALKAGDHLLVQREIYGGTHHFLNEQFERMQLEFTLADATDIAAFEAAIQENTKLIYIETPSNPLLKITDIKAIAAIAKRRGILTMIDNTFATPICQNPLELGIDIVMHSGTKYLGGHSDLIFGYIGSSKDFIERLLVQAQDYGSSLDARICYLIERSMKTLHLRMERACDNAMELAQFLAKERSITKVFYPGLPTHKDHDIAKDQMAAFGAMLTFELAANIDPVAFQKRLRLISPSVSLGGVESLICSPALTSHVKISQAERLKVGINDQQLRFSVGIEHVEDLKADILQAMNA